MLDILVDLGIGALSFLCVGHVPEDAEPLVEKAVVHGRGDVFGTLGIYVVLGIGVHGIVSRVASDQVSILVATAAGSVLEQLDLRRHVAGQDGARAVVHAMAYEIFVYKCIKLRAIVIVGLHRSRGALGQDAAVVHHQGRCHALSHGGHVGHIDVVHDSVSCRTPKSVGERGRGGTKCRI